MMDMLRNEKPVYGDHTRALVTTQSEETGEEDNESAFDEVMEYIRVSVQLVYEELADFRDDAIEKKIKNQKDLN